VTATQHRTLPQHVVLAHITQVRDNRKLLQTLDTAFSIMVFMRLCGSYWMLRMLRCDTPG
jgi:hypothetical protein